MKKFKNLIREEHSQFVQEHRRLIKSRQKKKRTISESSANPAVIFVKVPNSSNRNKILNYLQSDGFDCDRTDEGILVRNFHLDSSELKHAIERVLTEENFKNYTLHIELNREQGKFWDESDGWNEDILSEHDLVDWLDSVYEFTYEIKNARRGSYAINGDTDEDLVSAFKDLIETGQNVLKSLQRAIEN